MNKSNQNSTSGDRATAFMWVLIGYPILARVIFGVKLEYYKQPDGFIGAILNYISNDSVINEKTKFLVRVNDSFIGFVMNKGDGMIYIPSLFDFIILGYLPLLVFILLCKD